MRTLWDERREAVDTERIREAVSAEDVVRAYALATPEHNRIPCPFHDGRDRNFTIYKRSYYCFVCGWHGDIFKFVQEYFQLDFKHTLYKLNNDFKLGLKIGQPMTMSELKEVSQDYKKLVNMRIYREGLKEERERIRQELEFEYLDADKIVREKEPLFPCDEIPDDFVQAMKDLPMLEYEILNLPVNGSEE